MRRLPDTFRTDRATSFRIMLRGWLTYGGFGICRTCLTAKSSLIADLGHKRAMEAAEGPKPAARLYRAKITGQFLMVNEGMFPSVFSMV